MDLKMDVNGHDVLFHFNRRADWIVATFFKEFLIKIDADAIADHEHLETIKSSLNQAFISFATFNSQQLTGKEWTLSYRYIETIGFPYEEVFETMSRIQANWLVNAMKNVTVCQSIPYQIEIVFDHVYPYSNIIKNIEF